MSLPTLTSGNIMVGLPKKHIPQSVGKYIINNLKKFGSEVVMVDSVTGVEVQADTLLMDVAAVAEALRARGIGPGSVVGFCSENRLEYAIPSLACLAIGATCAPLSPLYTTSELKHAIAISEPSIIFCSPLTISKLIELKLELSFIRELIVFGDVTTDETITAFDDLMQRPADPVTIQPEDIDPFDSVCVLFCSSGTTGLPKCVELTHDNLLTFIVSMTDNGTVPYTEHDIILGFIPFFHGYGFGLLVSSLSIKMKIVVMAKFQEQRFLEVIQNHKVTTLFVVPPLCVFLAKSPIVDQYDLSSIRSIRSGAAPLAKDVQLAIQERLKMNNFKQGYGLTECSVVVCLMPNGINKIGSAGAITFGMECKVADLETGQALPPLKEGELCFRGPLVMKGYRNNKKATDESIDKDGWLHTGDIGYYDSNCLIYIVDRLKELIKYKGFQVAPAELEAILLAHPQIKDAAVIGIPDENAGELPYAYVVLQANADLTGPEIQKFVAEQVSTQKRLSGGVCFITEIPKNPSGKILRKELRVLYKSQNNIC